MLSRKRRILGKEKENEIILTGVLSKTGQARKKTLNRKTKGGVI